LQERGNFKVYNGTFSSEDAALEIRLWINSEKLENRSLLCLCRNWVIERISESEKKFVLKEISSSDFKSRPQDFKNVNYWKLINNFTIQTKIYVFSGWVKRTQGFH
jgi:hypothetical protein